MRPLALSKLIALLCLTCFALLPAMAADATSELAGKWSMKRKTDDGQSVTQQLTFKEGKFTFRILTEGGSTMIYAEGSAKVSINGGIKQLALTDIKAGGSDTELNPVDEQFAIPFRVSGNTMYVATGLDREREEGPRMDVYKKE